MAYAPTALARQPRPRRILTGLLAAALALIGSRPDADALDDPADASLTLPLWEVNLFYGAVRMPHYRGSDESMFYALPLPYLIYRGDILKIDREGLKSVFRESERFEAGFSVSGQPPPYRETQARDDMAEIGAILEFGPRLQFFAAGRDRPNPFYLAAAVRSAMSIDPDDLHTAGRGGRADVSVVYRNRTRWQAHNGSFGIRLSVDFADQTYNGYLYGVEPHEATASRPAYRARGGYAGMRLSVSGQKDLGARWVLGGYYRWDNLAGAVYRDSPLVKRENNHTVGCALIWKLLRSRKTISR